MENFEKNSHLENKSETDAKYFLGEVFAELEPFTFSIVKKLKESIDSGEYDVLIGDDASGRIPTLVLRGIFNERKRKLNPELKSIESEIKTRFVAGGQVENKEELKAALTKIKSECPEKALVITEYVSSGKSIKRIADTLKEIGIPFDVATLTTNIDSIEIPAESKFIYGELIHNDFYEDNPPAFYDVPELSGVIKDSSPKSYAVPLTKELVADEDELKDIQEKIGIARKDVDLLIKKTLKEVWGE